MKEIQEILREWQQAAQLRQSMAIATLVRVEGSTYRRAGARMLVLPDGRRIGSLSGGCLESDVAERARRVLETGEPCLVQYNSKVGFDVVAEMGCRGALSILVERVSQPESALALEFLDECFRQRHAGVLATVFDVEGSTGVRPGERAAFAQNDFRQQMENPALRDVIEADVRDAAATTRSAVKTYTLPDGVAHVLIEVIRPPVSLMVFGAGDDAVPLAKIASLLGWQTTILDHRPAYASPERFPTADQLLAGRSDDVLRKLPLDERSAAVIMSHNFEQDKAIMHRLLTANLPYVGILGPVRRTEELLAELRANGTVVPEAFLARLHSPAGLDVGSETPEEIALSIVAEIQAAFTQTAGGSLRRRFPSES